MAITHYFWGLSQASLMDQYCFARWCLSASVVVVCNTAHMQHNSLGGSMWRASRVTSS